MFTTAHRILLSTAVAAGLALGASGAGAAVPPPVRVTAMAASSARGAYWEVTANGQVTGVGGAHVYGSVAAARLRGTAVDIVRTPNSGGYWVLASNGSVFGFGDAHLYGSMAGRRAGAGFVALATTRDGKGYYELSANGRVFGFGDARFYGSTFRQRPVRPAVGLVTTLSDNGYWVITSGPHLVAFGGARGARASVRLVKGAVGMLARSVGGAGRWVDATDGRVLVMGVAGNVAGAPGKPGSGVWGGGPVTTTTTAPTTSTTTAPAKTAPRGGVRLTVSSLAPAAGRCVDLQNGTAAVQIEVDVSETADSPNLFPTNVPAQGYLSAPAPADTWETSFYITSGIVPGQTTFFSEWDVYLAATVPWPTGATAVTISPAQYPLAYEIGGKTYPINYAPVTVTAAQCGA